MSPTITGHGIPVSRAIVGERRGISAPSPAFLRETLPVLMDVTAVPGVAAGIVREGALTWTLYRGIARAGTDREIAADTLFAAASLGKPVFAHVALQLAAQARLDLDRPLKDYVPDHTPADAWGDTITARHALSHASGLPNWRDSSEQRLVPGCQPGSRFRYSGEAFYYLQRVVEIIEKRGIQRVMEQRLFEPCAMRASSYAWRGDTDQRIAFGHRRGEIVDAQMRRMMQTAMAHAADRGTPLSDFTHEDMTAAMSAFGPSSAVVPSRFPINVASTFVTTLEDYARFVARMLDDESAAPPRMCAPQVSVNNVLAWGLGWALERQDDDEYAWHWGNNGAFTSFVLAHVASRSAVIVFTNGSHGMRIAEAIVNAASGRAHRSFDWL